MHTSIQNPYVKRATSLARIKNVIKRRYQRDPNAILQLPESLAPVSPELTNYAIMQQRLAKGNGNVNAVKMLGKAVSHARNAARPVPVTTLKDRIAAANSRLATKRMVSSHAKPHQIPPGEDLQTLSNLTPAGLILRELRQAKTLNN